MTTDGQDLVRQLWQCIWIDGELEGLDDLIADPYVRHTNDGTSSMSRKAYKDHIADVIKTFKGNEITFDHLASSGDHVFARLTLTGVNIAAGNTVKITWLAHYRIRDARIAESWSLHENDLDW